MHTLTLPDMPVRSRWSAFLLSALFLLLALCGTAHAQRGGDYQVLQATYGTPWQSIDVTDRIRQLAQQGSRFQAGNDLFGTDPAPNQRKTLRISVRGRDGMARTYEYAESQWVDAAQFSPGNSWDQGGSWSGADPVVQATYGSGRYSIDVTDRIRQLARQGGGFQVGNDLFGTDPAPNQRKTLRVQTRGRDGRVRTADYAESQWVDAAQLASGGGGSWDQGGGWSGGDPVVQATYGSGRYSIDVTDRIRQLARQGGGFQVGNDLFGTDPAPNQRKTLRVQTRGRDGRVRATDYAESQWVDAAQLASGSGGGGDQGGWGRLTIHRATYGDGYRQVDVTERLRAAARDGHLDVIVGNDLAGMDPAPNVRKALRVEYSVGNGRVQQVTVEESQGLRLP